MRGKEFPLLDRGWGKDVRRKKGTLPPEDVGTQSPASCELLATLPVAWNHGRRRHRPREVEQMWIRLECPQSLLVTPTCKAPT